MCPALIKLLLFVQFLRVKVSVSNNWFILSDVEIFCVLVILLDIVLFFLCVVNRRPLGIDPEKGIGTAYEGIVKVTQVRHHSLFSNMSNVLFCFICSVWGTLVHSQSEKNIFYHVVQINQSYGRIGLIDGVLILRNLFVTA